MKFRITMLTLLALFCSTSFVFADDWPQWRGPFRTDISPAEGLLKEWPDGGPKLVWTYKDAGLGYSSFAIVDNKMYTMGTREETEYLLCLDANSGQELWATEVGPFLENGWGGGPRSTPSVDGDYVYTFSGQGHLACLEKANGKTKWNVDVKNARRKDSQMGLLRIRFDRRR